MPLAGSFKIKTLGCWANDLAIITFCWLPPLREPIKLSLEPVLMLSLSTSQSKIPFNSSQSTNPKKPPLLVFL